MTQPDVIVVGGGIGGLSAAYALVRKGLRVRVLERAKEFGEVGAGIQIAPNCTRILHQYGLLEPAKRLGVLVEHMVMRDALDGSVLTRLDLRDAERRYGFPYMVIHRSDLHALFLNACRDAGAELLTSQQVTGYENTAAGAAVTLADGGVHRASLVIAADGLHSVARQLLASDEPVNSAYVAYRGAVPIERARQNNVSETDVVVYIGPRCHFVQYPLRGGQMFNQVAVFESQRAVAGQGDWGAPDELDAAFAHACRDVRDGLALMWRDRWWRMFDRDPIADWVYGRIALLGDAAHPPLQYIAQGAIMAIEDGWVLAEHATRKTSVDWDAALAAYQLVRVEHCRRVVLTSRTWGALWHLDGAKRLRRNEILRARDTYDYSFVDWLYERTALTPREEPRMFRPIPLAPAGSRPGTHVGRPWLRLYRPGEPAGLTPEHSDALSMWRAGLGGGPFLYYFDTPVTAATVEAESDALAVAFAARGIGRGDRIALFLQNVPQFVIGLLAAWKLGAIAVPVNPMLKERELRYVLNDCGARAIVSLQDLWNSVASRAVEGTVVEIMITTSPLDYLGGQDVPPILAGHARQPTPGATNLAEVLREHRGAQPAPVTLGPSDVALLTYTSGTTGEPKGAMNTHGNVTFNATVYREWMSLTPADIVLAGAPLFHITGLIGHLAVAMLVPMPLVLSYRFEPATINRLTERHRCTFTVMAITAFTAMINDQSISECDLSSLTKAYSGGAPIAPSIVERFEREAGPYIHNIYGLTETTSPSHAVPFGRRAPVDPASGALSVGVPVYDAVARIVDERGDELPPGEIGEIVTSGPMVVPGYWNRPDATDRTLPGGELHTGDVGFMDAEGWFYLVDRKKDMIVASGYKVWPREVEDTLLRHPAVREAAVVGVPDEYRGETVWAYVSLRPGAQASPGELTAFCREQLAAYKYPRRIEVLPELPKTSTGKLLRRELREHARLTRP